MRCNKNRCKQSCRSAAEIRNRRPENRVSSCQNTVLTLQQSVLPKVHHAEFLLQQTLIGLENGRLKKPSVKSTSVSVLRTFPAPAHLSEKIVRWWTFVSGVSVRGVTWGFYGCMLIKYACFTTNSGDSSLTRDCGEYSIFLWSSCGMVARCSKLSCLQLTQIFCPWRCHEETGKWSSFCLAYFISNLWNISECKGLRRNKWHQQLL